MGAELVEAARRVAADVLAPAAEEVDQAPAVPRSHLDALVAAGLFARHAAQPEVFEALAGACGVTFFVWVQHFAPVRLLRASANAALADRWLPRLESGEVLGGVAFAHLRRPGPPAVSARRVEGGYVLSGEAPWVTSWGLAQMFVVAALTDDERVVFAAIPASAAGLRPSAPLRLMAMSASATVRLGFEDVLVDEADVIAELSQDNWRRRDRVATAKPNPAAFGVAATSIRFLSELDPGLAAALEDERLDCRTQSYGTEPGDPVALRAWALELALRCAYALVAATGGRAMQLSHPAQRLLREATFYAIQAQTPQLRRETLARLTR